ncbi:MAG: GNAT family N-acetyltransferase [Hyphomicrobiaceae bacterium]|nr:GNAT family N-acetyltransferase [Hyphomicrobiaceae bacterium]
MVWLSAPRGRCRTASTLDNLVIASSKEASLAQAKDAVTISIEDPGAPGVAALLAASDGYMAALYPQESNHMLNLAALRKPNVCFLVGRRAGAALGCGAVVSFDEQVWAELKRMWVVPAARGLGLGRRLLSELEDVARGRGLRMVRLETGIAQPEALGLYRSCGYVECGPFGDYRPDPLSIFMEKRL